MPADALAGAMPAHAMPAAVPAVRDAGAAPRSTPAATGSHAAGGSRPIGTPPGARFGVLLEARLAGERAPDAAAPARLATRTPPAPHPVAAALRGVEAAQARLDAILAAARSGRTYSAAELLALQAEAHRFSQALDVAGKLVEHGVQGVKQTLQAQV